MAARDEGVDEGLDLGAGESEAVALVLDHVDWVDRHLDSIHGLALLRVEESCDWVPPPPCA